MPPYAVKAASEKLNLRNEGTIHRGKILTAIIWPCNAKKNPRTRINGAQTNEKSSQGLPTSLQPAKPLHPRQASWLLYIPTSAGKDRAQANRSSIAYHCRGYSSTHLQVGKFNLHVLFLFFRCCFLAGR